MVLPLGGCVTLVRLHGLSVLGSQSTSPALQLFFLVESQGDNEAEERVARQPLPAGQADGEPR